MNRTSSIVLGKRKTISHTIVDSVNKITQNSFFCKITYILKSQLFTHCLNYDETIFITSAFL